ncbi:ribonuclease Y [Anaerosoma tenue]|uniref:ribonuclease Y n=1 Tax=Anaerosoma tenue TaxID=2933588 RepID=UPI002260E30A|nr:ribonuclease Y [Anaerosoma tenue]MCK8114247.1 ribonuclease Y [Anaerosoma tenue]
MGPVIYALLGLVIGVVLGIVINRFIIAGKTTRAREAAERLLADAEKQAETTRKEMLLEAKDEILRLKGQAEEEAKERRKELGALENRLLQREESLDRRTDSLDKREHQMSSQAGQIIKREKELEDAIADEKARLESLAGMTTEEAKSVLLERVRQDVSHDSAMIVREAEQRAREEADRKARNIIGIAIGRVAADHTAESTVSVVHIPSDDLKGRIIGREGRNIRAFEQLTGINLIIDDTPEAVILSSFDPVRREVGRITLENLIADGRIHPARIEEMFKKAEQLVDQQVFEAGEQAVFDTGVHNLHHDIVRTLGRLRYRTSYGQNVLNHSLEVAYLSGVMAAELGLDPALAKRAGLLHDLGKAIDHEIEGPHAVIGADLARRLGENKEVVHCIEAHHGDVEPQTVEAVIVQAADAISAARPGARRETLESYIKRLEKLESLAESHKGVEKSYAMQAGREIRVMVKPEDVSDADSTLMARDIAKQIEEELQYPGQIKVMVIRESRAVEYAK